MRSSVRPTSPSALPPANHFLGSLILTSFVILFIRIFPQFFWHMILVLSYGFFCGFSKHTNLIYSPFSQMKSTRTWIQTLYRHSNKKKASLQQRGLNKALMVNKNPQRLNAIQPSFRSDSGAKSLQLMVKNRPSHQSKHSNFKNCKRIT